VLRALVVALLVANLAFYAWSEGWLDGVVGMRAQGDREPERLTLQVRPEMVKVLTPQAAAAAASAAASKLVCLEAGPFGPSELAAAESALSAVLPVGTWVNLKADRPGTWIVYMGRFADVDARRSKEQELARARLAFEVVRSSPDLEPGLSLGRYDDRGDAEAALAQLMQRGVRTAKLVEISKPVSLRMLRVAHAGPDLAAKVAGLKAEAFGKGFGACAKP